MKRFYFTGHNTFSNRGCEAIVRSTVGLLKQQFGDIEVLVPSNDTCSDSKQWPEAAEYGVRFVSHYYPFYTRYWQYLQRFKTRQFKQMVWPFPLSDELRKTFEGVDAVISIGGDNYSLDYGFPSLVMAMDRLAMEMGKPVILWGASVGPFDKDKDSIPIIRRNLASMSLITVRESISEKYICDTLGLSNPTCVADPAFILKMQSLNMDSFWPEVNSSGVLGLNISPLLFHFGNPSTDLYKEIVEFIQHVVTRCNLSVLLVPHVVPRAGSGNKNDALLMQRVMKYLKPLKGRVRMIDDNLNTAQLKYVISQCRYFIGARTHSTIAALSSGIPTTSISYSIKSKGINKDIFGHNDHVLEVQDLSVISLSKHLARLIAREHDISMRLKDTASRVRRELELATSQLAVLLQ